MPKNARQVLRGKTVVSVAVNVPGPVLAAKLASLGAKVIKVEPPAGDPLAKVAPRWYRDLARRQKIVCLDLKTTHGFKQLEKLLAQADLLITSSRPSSLKRAGLSWPVLHRKFRKLSQIAITGFPGRQAERPGHDLTYQAKAGLLTPPMLPRVTLADFAGAFEASTEAVALLLANQPARFHEVTLSDALETLAAPLEAGITAPGGVLGGGVGAYNLFQTRAGWVAVAALEPQFAERLAMRLGVKTQTLWQPGALKRVRAAFRKHTARDWENWAIQNDVPLCRVRDRRKT